MNVLFLCSRNRRRSPTAEEVFRDWPGVETASAGVNADADSPVTPELLAWANVVMVMEPALVALLKERVPQHLPPA